MLQFLLQLSPATLPQQTTTLPELPPGPSPERVRGPVEIPVLEPWQIVLITLACIVIAALIGWKLFRHIRSSKQQQSPLSPRDEAIAALNAAANFAASNDEQFAVMSSLALRRYFETGKGIDALGRTTDEFLKSLSDHTLLNAAARQSLDECLRRCDQVKFAGSSLTETERHALTESALELIHNCETAPSATDQKAQS